MGWETLLLIALVLICPLSMLWMMRHRHQDEESEKTGAPGPKSDEYRS